MPIHLLLLYSFGIWKIVFGKFTGCWVLWKELHASWCGYTCCCYENGFHCNGQRWWTLEILEKNGRRHRICKAFSKSLVYVKLDGIFYSKFFKKTSTINLFHLNKIGSINALATNVNGTYLCTASSDKSIKIFDVINFDMINMIKLDFEPKCVEWIHNPNDAIPALAV